MPGVSQIDLITGFLSFLFTILILSYVIGDNPAFRLAIHAFVGVSAGYVAIVIFRQVVVDKMFLPMLTGTMLDRVLLAFPLVMSLLLLGKLSPRSEWVGRPVVALLVGIGTASAISGAIIGTLFPQIAAASVMFDLRQSPDFGALAGSLLTAVFALAGTIATLVYFQFTVRSADLSLGSRGRIMKFFALLGQVFIAITLGTIFAGVLAAALTALVERMQSIVLFLDMIFSQFIH
jgi:hypothetical protein